ncbi:MAG: SAM-dependent chlorinase/fluorinase [Planctomycetota bacterium]|nr:SAM-dependent chlorinase/fluorinase [Planctomycetota bacterium]
MAAAWISIALLSGCASAPPTVAFMSDFGTTDDSVAVCKGEMIRVAPAVRVVDITHQVTPYAVDEAARYLAGCINNFPPRTVFVCVVDPGVGSERKPIAARTASGHFYVGPDNGLLTLVDNLVAAREITNTAWMAGTQRSSTFHGRDIFSPVAAHLARGDAFAAVGPALPLDKLVRLNLAPPTLDAKGIQGEVIGLDGPYGNLVTNIPAGMFAKLGHKLGDTVSLTLAGKTMTLPFVKTFSDVPEGKPLLYIDSRGRLSAAINMGDFAKVNQVSVPAKISVARR